MSAEHSGDETPTRAATDRYDFSDLFDDMGPETETVYNVIGFIMVLLLLCLALYYPVIVSQ